MNMFKEKDGIPALKSYIANIRLKNPNHQIFFKENFLIVGKLTSFKQRDDDSADYNAGNTGPAHQVGESVA